MRQRWSNDADVTTADVAAEAALCHGVAVAENYVAELDFGAPKIEPDAFIAPTAVVVGAVSMGSRSSIWYGAVARADFETIEIGEGSNVQDGCTLHSDPGFPLVLGRGVTVGHRVVLHGARVDDDVLVGMGSVVMNGAHIGSGSIVAAGAVVTPGTEVPPGSVVAGIPAKVVRQANDDDLAHIKGNAKSYTDRLASARQVRPVVRTNAPPGRTRPRRRHALIPRSAAQRTLDRKAFVRTCCGLLSTSRGAPDSTITPSSMKTSVSPTSRANPISCVTTTIVMPSCGQPAHDVEHLADQLGVERRGRLVEEHQLRVHRQRPGDRHALLLAAGELVRVVVHPVAEADPIEQLACRARGRRSWRRP